MENGSKSRIFLKKCARSGREYAGLCAVMLIIQIVFFLTALQLGIDNANARKLISEGYDYHIVVSELDDYSATAIENRLNTEIGLENKYISSFRRGSGDDGLSIFVKLSGGSPKKAARELKNVLSETIQSYKLSYSPLYDLNGYYIASNIGEYFGGTLVLLLLAVAVISLVYRVELEGKLFKYGIFATFGATKKRFLKLARKDLLISGGITFLPAGIFAVIISAVISSRAGVGFFFAWYAPFAVLVLDFILLMIGVLIPVRAVAGKMPAQMIPARDNSDIVSSPRRSSHILGKKFPLHYQLLGMWRYRKYYLRLLVSAAVFCAVFITGVYVSDITRANNTRELTGFTLEYGRGDSYSQGEADSVNSDTALFIGGISEVDGVDYVSWDISTPATNNASHILIKRKNISSSAYSVIDNDSREGYYAATDSYQYTAIDKEYVDMLTEAGAKFEGDPYEVLENKKNIIISEDIYNTRRFSFEPGDTVYICAPEKIPDMSEMSFNKPTDVLRYLIDNGKFSYTEYRVCAVVRGISDAGAFMLGVNFDSYRELTGEIPAKDKLEIIMKKDAGLGAADAAGQGIKAAVKESGCFGWTLYETDGFIDSTISDGQSKHIYIYIISLLFLIVSPIVWLISQTGFGMRRTSEYKTLSALGAHESDIIKIHLISGGVLSVAAFLVSALAGFISTRIIFFLVNDFLPSYGFIDPMRYRYSLNIPALAVCAAVSLAFGFASSMIPYVTYKKEMKKSAHGVKEGDE